MRRVVMSLTALYILSALVRIWYEPNGGQTWRQTVTLGMTTAFAEEVRHRGLGALDFLFLPRILERGFLDGINASEFPLLNVSTGLFFLGNNPRIGVFLSGLLILFLNLWTAGKFLPRYLQAWGATLSAESCLLLWFGVHGLSSLSVIVMPEGMAFPLVMIGSVLLLETSERVWKFTAGIVLCGMGVAVKPTMVLILGSLALLPLLRQGYRSRIRPLWSGCLISLAFPAWWYGLHSKYILSIAQGPQIFAPATFAPFSKLAEVGWGQGVMLLLQESLSGQFPIYTGWLFLVAAFLVRERLPIALYFLSLVALIALDGKHILGHRYYFMGAGIFSLVVIARLLAALRTRPRWHTAALLLLCWGMAYNIRTNVWSLAHDSNGGRTDHWAMGRMAREVIPPDTHLVTDDHNYPYRMLMIGRSGTAAGDGIYEICDQPVYRDRRLALVSVRPSPSGDRLCGRPIAFKREVRSCQEEWFITVVEPDTPHAVGGSKDRR